jgi:prepilin-type processing-associated H-X9-DG protein
MAESPEPEPKSSGCRITLAGLMVIMVIIILCAALIIPALISTTECSGHASCRHNLVQLYKAMHVYCAAFGKNREYMPHVGDAFFTCLLGHTGPEHPNAYMMKAPCYGCLDLCVCPSSGSDGTSVTPGGSMEDYRGPARHPLVPSGNPSALVDGIPSDYPIACDKLMNHKGAGGNVLRFDGSVSFLTDTEYTDASNKCSD